MTANSAYANVFSELGLFDSSSESARFDTIAMTSCGPLELEEVCSSLPNDDSSMGQLRTLIAVSNKFNFSMPQFVYEMVSIVCESVTT